MRRNWASLGFCMALLAVGSAFGHARLLGAVPAPDAELTGPPPSLTLKFNESVRLGMLQLWTAGHEIPLTIDHDAPAASTVTLPLPRLAAGTYEVRWSALTASDGHVVKGVYSFSIR